MTRKMLARALRAASDFILVSILAIVIDAFMNYQSSVLVLDVASIIGFITLRAIKRIFNILEEANLVYYDADENLIHVWFVHTNDFSIIFFTGFDEELRPIYDEDESKAEWFTPSQAKDMYAYLTSVPDCVVRKKDE